MYKILSFLYKFWKINSFGYIKEYPTAKELRNIYGDNLVSELLYHGYIQLCGDNQISITILGVQQYQQLKNGRLLTLVAIMSMIAAFYPILKDALVVLLSLV